MNILGLFLMGGVIISVVVLLVFDFVIRYMYDRTKQNAKVEIIKRINRCNPEECHNDNIRILKDF